MCERRAEEDVEHLLVTGEFERDQWVLADEVSRIVGAGEWLEEEECKEGKVALLLGKGVEGATLVEEAGECVMYWIGKQ